MMNLDLGDTRLIITTCMRYGLLRNQAAYVLATAYWETGRTMRPVKEAFWVKNAESWRERNLRYWPWYGRGYSQLTWERNYIKAGNALGVDFTQDPDDVMKPEYAAQILVVGASEGWFTGKRLSDYMTLKNSNFRGARRIINGTDNAATIAEIARGYDAALLRDGYGVEAQAPVVDDRRDGTPPRKHPAQSKTILAQVVQFIGLGVAGAGKYFGGQSEIVQVAMIGGAAVVVVAGFVVFRERLKHWADGVR